MTKSEAKAKVERAQKVYNRAVEFYNATKTTKSYKYLQDCERRLNDRLTQLMQQA